jgi:3-phosphoshikimate 1-carboxyvinyltransferase
VKVHGGGIAGGKTSIRGDVSSQFISGLMFACPKAQRATEIVVTTPLESKGYVEMTREVLAEHGIRISISEDYGQIRVPSGQTYKPHDHRVPGDFSSAAFLLAAAAITRSEVTVNNLDYSLVQGDKAIVGILKQMGVNGKVCSNRIEIEGTGEPLKSIDVNAKDTPDLVPISVVLACYANGASRIRGVQRLRLKESDRLTSLHDELGKMGADIAVDEGSIAVKGSRRLHGAEIDPHDDHRIAMACAVAALRAEGETIIRDAECVKKSYPRFFIDLQRLGVDLVGGKFDR